MALMDVDWNPPSRQLRQFAGIFSVFFPGLAVYLYLRHGVGLPTCAAIGSIAVVIGGAGLIRPPLIRPVYVAMMALALPIGMVISTVLLAVLYYLVLTPIGLALRLSGKDRIEKRGDPQAGSYWVRRKQPESMERYFRQY